MTHQFKGLHAVALGMFLLSTLWSCKGEQSDAPKARTQSKPPVHEPTRTDPYVRDLEMMVETILRVHPGPFTKISRARFKKLQQRIQVATRQGDGVIAFWRLAAPLVASIGDAHTSLSPPVQMLRRHMRLGKATFLPLSPIIMDGHLYVHSSTARGLRPGDEILSINGEPVKKLLSRLLSVISYGRRAYAEMILENSLPGFLYLVTGMNHTFRLTLRRGEKSSSVTVQGMRGTLSGGRIFAHERAPFSMVSHQGGRVVRLVINSFSQHAAFKKFVDDAMDTLRAHPPELLLMDLRFNMGGDSRLGDYLIGRLFRGSWSQALKVSLKVSRDVRSRYKGIAAVTGASDGAVLDLFSWSAPRTPLKRRWFKGEVGLLTGPFTFSSGVLFAALFKNFGLGRIAGEETGGLANHFGDVISVTLPNSRLTLKVSHKRFITDPEASGGVVPHIPVTPGAAGLLKTKEAYLNEVFSNYLPRKNHVHP